MNGILAKINRWFCCFICLSFFLFFYFDYFSSGHSKPNHRHSLCGNDWLLSLSEFLSLLFVLIYFPFHVECCLCCSSTSSSLLFVFCRTIEFDIHFSHSISSIVTPMNIVLMIFSRDILLLYRQRIQSNKQKKNSQHTSQSIECVQISSFFL